MAKEANLAEIILEQAARPKINYDKCKVIVTIGGPLTETVDQLAEMLEAGMTVARFDFTSGSRTLEQHLQTLENLRAAQKRTRCLCAIYCALGGNIFAVSRNDPEKEFNFTKGQTVKLLHGKPMCDDSDVLHLDSSIGGSISRGVLTGDVVFVHPFLRAGELTAELEVTSISEREIVCVCRNDVEVPSTVKRLAVNFSGAKNAPPFNACDEVIVNNFAVPANVDFISVGAVRDGGMLGSSSSTPATAACQASGSSRRLITSTRFETCPASCARRTWSCSRAASSARSWRPRRCSRSKSTC